SYKSQLCFGLEGVARYLNANLRGIDPVLNFFAIRIVLKLLALLGLNPALTMATEMDERRAYFVCMSCAPTQVYTAEGQFQTEVTVMDWRASVLHEWEMHPDTDVVWRALSEREQELAVQIIPLPGADLSHWGCRLCSSLLKYSSDPLWPGHVVSSTAEEVAEHLCTVHGIEANRVAANMFYDPCCPRTMSSFSIVFVSVL
ncbi:hypothetical protein OF83DRAFT_220503, partial [Amylostereum chailletii]